MRSTVVTLAKRRVLGVLFLVLLLLSVWLTHAVFTKKFVDYVPVWLEASKTGLQLPSLADVKIRGVLVGQVREIENVPGDGVRLLLGIDPDEAGVIPANATGLILPKTLFGEKYVALQVPDDPAREAVQAGDVISQSDVAIEVEKVLSDVYPLLQAVRPSDLAHTLNALATALEGRGEKLGQGLVELDDYLTKLNPQVPGLIRDLRLLSQVSDNYSEIMPQLGRLLRNAVVTGDTLLERERQLRSLFTEVTALSSTSRDFLQANGENIIRLGEVSSPTVALLEEYAPEYPCLLQGMANWVPRGNEIFRDHTLQVNLETIPYQPEGYDENDQPKYGLDQGPYCGTLPSPPYDQNNPTPNPSFYANEEGDGVAGTQGKYRAAPRYDMTSGFSGTEAEQRVVAAIAGPVLDVPADQVPDIATLLFGPVARGTEVNLR